MLYSELVAYSKARFDNFFKNVVIYENHFTWSNFNEECYEKMYTENSYDNLASVMQLKSEIDELKITCRKCGEFFIPQRNKSIPSYDIILGKQLEEALMSFLGTRINAKFERADLENRSLPDCKVVNNDGKIVAYLEVKFHAAPFVLSYLHTDRYCYEGSATLDYKKVVKQLNLIDELGDIPVYYVHWIEYPCLKGIFYETSKQVSENTSSQKTIFDRKRREGDNEKTEKAVYLSKIYSPLLSMKSFEQLVKEINKLLEVK